MNTSTNEQMNESADCWRHTLQVLELPQLLHDDVAEQHVYLLIGSEGGSQQAKLLPDTAQSKQFLLSLSTDVFFWQEDKAAGGST